MGFREVARDWLENNCPESMRTPTPGSEYISGGRRAKYVNPDSRLWLDRMAEQGWTAPTWPIEYGGGGLTQEKNHILMDEMRRINARSP